MLDNLDPELTPAPKGAEPPGLNVIEWDSLCRGLPLAEQDIDRVLTTLLDDAPAAPGLDSPGRTGGSWLSAGENTDSSGYCPHKRVGARAAFRSDCLADAPCATGENAVLTPAGRQALQTALAACVAQLMPRLDCATEVTTLFNQTFLPAYWRALERAGGGLAGKDG